MMDWITNIVNGFTFMRHHKDEVIQNILYRSRYPLYNIVKYDDGCSLLVFVPGFDSTTLSLKKDHNKLILKGTIEFNPYSVLHESYPLPRSFEKTWPLFDQIDIEDPIKCINGILYINMLNKRSKFIEKEYTII